MDKDLKIVCAFCGRSKETLEAFKELLEHSKQAAVWVPHILLLTAIENAEKALNKEEERNE